MTFTAELYKQATGKAGLITVVTAFVPIPGHPRSEEEYHRLAEPLMSMQTRVPMVCAEGELDKCWLYKHLYTNSPAAWDRTMSGHNGRL